MFLSVVDVAMEKVAVDNVGIEDDLNFEDDCISVNVFDF